MFILIIIVFLCAIAVLLFNRFVKNRFLVREALSGIDVQLKRRHDLIPNIVEAVKGYARYERNTLEEITNIRAGLVEAATVKEKSEKENKLSAVFKNIFALVENYPDLKASKEFLELQKNLTEIEDQIQMARRYYNGTVRNYNILVESFPSNILAAAFKFKHEDFFEIEYATERAVPDVKFSS